MRNLKRALSLALASVMLLGMMVVGSSAAFADADEIVNKEAVEITAGLGLFAGSDGKFNPTGTVTRAQMATVIAKMLYGSEINADQFKGSGKFSDTAAFEGGWAEGYINLCSNLGIVGGYGDGTYKPGQAVTTAEAVTMIINALGVDAGEGTWPVTVMAKAEEMKLFEELAVKPGTNVALTRDQLASIVLEGVKYSPEGIEGYEVTIGNKKFQFDNIADALKAAENYGGMDAIDEVEGEDSLWHTVFEVKKAEGIVTANQATGKDYTVITTATADIELDLETGLDMIGHYVIGYYTEEYTSAAKPGAAYCVVDEAEYIVVKDAIDEDRKEFVAAFGAKELKLPAVPAGEEVVITIVDNEYYVGTDSEIPEYDYDNKSAAAGTYMVYEGDMIGYFAPAKKSVVEIEKVTTNAGKESIKWDGKTYSNSEADDEVVEYEGIAKEDIAIVVKAQDMYVLTKANKLEANTITKTGVNADGDELLTIDGTVYEIAAYAKANMKADLLTSKDDVTFTYTYEIYTDANGKVIGFEELEGSADLGDIVYDLGAYVVETKDAYGNKVRYAYAQVVDLEGKESSLLIGVDYERETESLKDVGVAITNVAGEYVVADYEIGFKAFELAKTADEKKAGIMVADEDAVKVEPTEGKATVFVDTFDGEFDGKVTKFRLTNNGLAFATEDTKYVLVDGAAGKTLKTAVMTGNVKLNDGVYSVVASSDKNGNITLEAVVYVADGLSLPSADLIYISEVNYNAQAAVADAIEVEVYFVATAEFKTIKVEDTVSFGAGFYSYEYDATEEIYTDLTGETIPGQLFYGVEMDGVFGTKLIAAGIDGIEAAEAAVIDTRSAEELKKSEFAEVKDLEDLADLVADDIKVVLDVMLDDDDQETVVAIFVVSVEEIEEA